MRTKLPAGLILLLAVALPTSAQPPDWSPERDPEYQIAYHLGAAPWISSQEHEGVVHLLFAFPSRILRYDLEAQIWLPHLPLPATPTAMALDGDDLFVAIGAEVRRYDLDGGNETLLRTASGTVHELLVDGSHVFLALDQRMESVDRVSGALIDTEDFFRSYGGSSISRSSNRIYSRSTSTSPSDILAIDYEADGSIGPMQDSPFHGDFPSAEQTWVFPSKDRVADNAGIVYDGDLTYGGSLAGNFDDLAFHDTGPVVLRGSELHSHGWDLLETGRFALVDPVREIFADDTSIFGFFSSAEGADVVVIPRAAIVPPVADPPLDPRGVAFTPDRVALSIGGVLHLLSAELRSVVRWSTELGDYLETISLFDTPIDMAYSDVHDALFLAYSSGRVTRLLLTAEPPVEEPLLNTPQTPCGLSVAGPWIFLCDPSGAWFSHYTYSPTGELISAVEWNYASSEFVWSEANSRIYFIRESASPLDILWEEIDPASGTIGTLMDSPFHSSEGMVQPLRVHPEGSIVLLGSGRYYEALSLSYLEELGTGYIDAQWSGDQLVTLHEVGPEGDDSELRTWNDFLAAVVAVEPAPGAPIALRESAGTLWAVTSVDGVPTFHRGGTGIFADGFEAGDVAAWSASVP